MTATLLPCPFCGGPAEEDRCDRIIVIGCKPCGYTRPFDGLLSGKPSAVPVSEFEFYHADADEKANAAWNVRAPAIGNAS